MSKDKNFFEELGGQASDGYKKWFGAGSPLEAVGTKLGFGPGDHTNDEAAQSLIEQIIANGKDFQAPTIGPVSLVGQNYQGDVTPERIAASLADTKTAGPTHMNEVAVDPRLKEAQLRALASLQGVADSGGMTASDVANMRRMQSQVSGDDAGRRNAILQNMQQRGLGGSGMELLAQLQGSQASTDREAQQGLDIQGMAQQRALQAMMNAGTMGGDIRGQDFAEQSRIKAAQDAIDAFNTQAINHGSQFNAGMNQQAVTGNADRGLRADMRNKDTTQSVANANTGIVNQQTMTNNVALPQQNFQNVKTALDTRQNAYVPGVNYYTGKQTKLDQEQGNKAGSTLGAAGSIIGAIYGGPSGAAAGNQAGQAAGKKSWRDDEEE